MGQSGSIIRRTFKDSLAILHHSYPGLKLQDSVDKLTSLEDERDEKNLKNLDPPISLPKSSDNQSILHSPNTLYNSGTKSNHSVPENYSDVNDFHHSRHRSSSFQKSKRHHHEKYYHGKYYYEKHAHRDDKFYYNERYGDEKHRRSSRSSRYEHKEPRRSRKKRSYSRSRSRSPSHRSSYNRETSKLKSGKDKKKREKYLRQISSEYHSEYDDLYKSYQHVVDDISCKEREDFYKNKSNKLLPFQKSTMELDISGLSETAIQELKDSHQILQTIDQKKVG